MLTSILIFRMHILVTGAYGQLGSEINALKSEFSNLSILFTDVDSLDITNEKDVEAFFASKSIDVVVNCAAYTAVDKAETDKESAHLINAVAPGILAKQADRIDAKFIHISTDYVFDGQACVPYNEKDKVDPQGIYGKTKLEGEQNVLNFNPNSIIIRTSWLYSAFGNNFVKTMLRLGAEKSEISVVFDQVGTPTYAADLARAILKIIGLIKINESSFVPGIYHYSNEGVASWYDFSKCIFERSDFECRVFPVLSNQFPTPAKRPAYSVLDKSKIKNTFNLQIPYWKDSLQLCLNRLQK